MGLFCRIAFSGCPRAMFHVKHFCVKRRSHGACDVSRETIFSDVARFQRPPNPYNEGAMTVIADSAELAGLCQRLTKAEYIAVDTEFMRDKTYYPQLCLVQIAGPDEAAAIDTLAPGIDLKPMFDLLVAP
jgi:hypothetical protein